MEVEGDIVEGNEGNEAIGWGEWAWEWVYYVGSFIPSFNILGSSDSNDSNSNTDHWTVFQRNFEETYGPDHPGFFMGDFSQAASHAKRNFKFILLYLHSPRHVDTTRFSTEILCNKHFSDFIDNHFVFWAGDISFSEPFRVAKAFRACSFPYLAIVNANEGISHVRLLAKFDGIEEMPLQGGLDSLLASLVQVMELHGNILLDARAQDRENVERSTIMKEQDEEYQRSLREDMFKEQQRIEEEALEAEKEKDMALKKESLSQRRIEVLHALGHEPPEDSSSCSIVIRLSNGTRVQRRFRDVDLVKMIYQYVEVEEIALCLAQEGKADESLARGAFRLVSNFPRTVHSDQSLSLREANLIPHASLFVEPVD